jgi:hypothetical protein
LTDVSADFAALSPDSPSLHAPFAPNATPVDPADPPILTALGSTHTSLYTPLRACQRGGDGLCLGGVGKNGRRSQGERRQTESLEKISTCHCCGHLILRVLEHERGDYISIARFRHAAL